MHLAQGKPISAPNPEQILRFLRLSNDVGKRAISLGHHLFCAVLVAPNHERVFSLCVCAWAKTD
ncbi:hypothetical protein [Acinetobacter sp. ANC 4633]|uniref:hypothetical protein n=1 Tax=Acinetobacter sp. ANC 4633 TaxID=2529845 RepID=UPI001D1814EC|nr:hypothetical protein [Acinetobacter sp. ANC 4633]